MIYAIARNPNASRLNLRLGVVALFVLIAFAPWHALAADTPACNSAPAVETHQSGLFNFLVPEAEAAPIALRPEDQPNCADDNNAQAAS